MIKTKINITYGENTCNDCDLIVPSQVLTSTKQEETLDLTKSPNFQIIVPGTYIDNNGKFEVTFTIGEDEYTANMVVVNNGSVNCTLQYVDGLIVPEDEGSSDGGGSDVPPNYTITFVHTSEPETSDSWDETNSTVNLYSNEAWTFNQDLRATLMLDGVETTADSWTLYVDPNSGNTDAATGEDDPNNNIVDLGDGSVALLPDGYFNKFDGENFAATYSGLIVGAIVDGVEVATLGVTINVYEYQDETLPALTLKWGGGPVEGPTLSDYNQNDPFTPGMGVTIRLFDENDNDVTGDIVNNHTINVSFVGYDGNNYSGTTNWEETGAEAPSVDHVLNIRFANIEEFNTYAQTYENEHDGNPSGMSTQCNISVNGYSVSPEGFTIMGSGW